MNQVTRSNPIPQNLNRQVTVASLVKDGGAYAKRFAEVLGKRAPQFVSSMINLSNTMVDTEPHSIIQSAMVAATLDLPVDKNLGFAWVVPYKTPGGGKKAQFQMGYKGFVQLALRTGQYKRMNACPINAEVFEGYDEIGEPKLNWEKYDPTKEITHYFVGWTLVNGFTKCCVWSRDRVKAHADRYSQSARSGRQSPWQTHFDEMATKTVLKNELSGWGIMSIEMRQAFAADQAVVENADSGAFTYPDNPAAADDKFTPAPAKVPETATEGTVIDTTTTKVEVEGDDQIPGAEAPPPEANTDDGYQPGEQAQPPPEQPKPAPAPTTAPPPSQSFSPEAAELKAKLAEAQISEAQFAKWALAKLKMKVNGVDNLASAAPRKVAQVLANFGTYVADIKSVS